jgi:hypothetical protein
MAAYRLGRFPALSWRLGAGGAGSGEADSIPPSSPLTITAYLAAQGGSSKSGRSSEPAATKAPSLMIETDNLTPCHLRFCRCFLLRRFRCCHWDNDVALKNWQQALGQCVNSMTSGSGSPTIAAPKMLE